MKTRLVNPKFTSDFGRKLMEFRGIKDFDWYINPTDARYLESYENLENMSAGIALLSAKLDEARELNKKILLIVDCDNDGFTSATIMYQYIKHLDNEIVIDYWLHEHKAHGLEDHIDRLMDCQQDYSLVILPDSSSNDYQYHEMLDIPCLVLDHHLAEPPFSKKAVIINNQLSPNYSNKDNTGAGIAWQFCRAYDDFIGDTYAWELIDLAAWGIIGDMGSLISNENRYIIHAGLHNIKNMFFKVLIDKQDFSMGGKVNPITVAFYIVPLTNAMIRVGTMAEKERMFLAYIDGMQLVPSNKRGAKGTMEKVAVESARECTNARTKQKKYEEEVTEQLEIKIFKYDLLENKILFVRLDDEDFPSELTGLIAMQLSKKFKKPTIVARLNDEGYCRGSARGLNESELKSFKDYLESTGLFEYAQGHDNAFGVSIKDDNLKAFHQAANQDLSSIDFGESVYDVNFEYNAYEYETIRTLVNNLDLYDGLWGQDNPTPLVSISNLRISKKDVQIIGKNQNTLKFEKDGIVYIKFFANDMIEELSHMNEICISVVGKPNLNEFMGRFTPQIMIENYEAHEDSILDF